MRIFDFSKEENTLMFVVQGKLFSIALCILIKDWRISRFKRVFYSKHYRLYGGQLGPIALIVEKG